MESAIQKDLKNGFFLCTICQTQVKAKAWTAHVNGRKHRENVQNLKKQLLAKSMEANKRKLSESENEDTDSKRQKGILINLRETFCKNVDPSKN